MGKHLIKGEVKATILNGVAQYKKPKEIIEIVKKLHNKNINNRIIAYHKNHNGELIEKFRTFWLQDLVDVPIAQKRVRLEREEEIYDKADEIENPVQKYDLKLKCLVTARDEVEGKNQNVTYAQFNQYNNLSDEELLEKKKVLEATILKLPKTNATEQN